MLPYSVGVSSYNVKSMQAFYSAVCVR